MRGRQGQASFAFRTRGGARPGAGRPARGPRPIRHDPRIASAVVSRFTSPAACCRASLLVEVESGEALTRGICGFLISAARHINGALGVRGARVFERYHARSLATPREVRNCIAYVLNNWRHHGEDRTPAPRAWRVDKYAGAVAFDGWAELGGGVRFAAPVDYEPLATRAPLGWLLATGWRRRGLVHVDEVPGRSGRCESSSKGAPRDQHWL